MTNRYPCLIALHIKDTDIKGSSRFTTRQSEVELLPSTVFHTLLCSEELLNRKIDLTTTSLFVLNKLNLNLARRVSN